MLATQLIRKQPLHVACFMVWVFICTPAHAAEVKTDVRRADGERLMHLTIEATMDAPAANVAAVICDYNNQPEYFAGLEASAVISAEQAAKGDALLEDADDVFGLSTVPYKIADCGSTQYVAVQRDLPFPFSDIWLILEREMHRTDEGYAFVSESKGASPDVEERGRMRIIADSPTTAKVVNVLQRDLGIAPPMFVLRSRMQETMQEVYDTIEARAKVGLALVLEAQQSVTEAASAPSAVTAAP